jgi:hypothetical protein
MIREKIHDNIIFKKILRSLPERFRPKVNATEENNNLDNMKVEELVGSLSTYEWSLPQPKKKTLALKTVREGGK